MKTLLACLSLAIAPVALSQRVNLQVQDELGRPVAGAETSISFTTYTGDSNPLAQGKTDEQGRVVATGFAQRSILVMVRKDGYYEARWELKQGQDHNATVVLPRILRPTPLHALRAARMIPVKDEWVGFDLQVADWMPPHGKGKVTDLLFRYKNEFKGWNDHIEANKEKEFAINKKIYEARGEPWSEESFKLRAGKWDGEMEISFPGEKDGYCEAAWYLPYSRLKLPHEAPIDGYRQGWRYARKTYGFFATKEDMGYFLRTRTKLDDTGRIVSAHYAKIRGDIIFGPLGGILIVYYFNPVPNDRNLEFDPERNLFPKELDGAYGNPP